MKRLFPGLHGSAQTGTDVLEGVFLVRVDHAYYRWHPQRPFYFLRLAVLEPKQHQGRVVTGRLYCTPKALWKLNWFLRDFGYDPDLLGRDELDEKALLDLRGIILTSKTILSGRCFTNLDGFAPSANWEELQPSPIITGERPNRDL